MAIETVGIVGTGTGGAELAEQAAIAGLEVIALHVEGDDPLALWESLTQSLAWQVTRGTLSEAGRDLALARVHLASEPETLSRCDLVYECGTRLAPEARHALLVDIEQHLDPRAILTSGAPSVGPGGVAPRLLRPCRFLQLNVLHREATRFIEVVPTDRTRPAVIDAVEHWIVRLGRAPLRISDPGGITAAPTRTERSSVF
jgi:3-hydroxyacyl-CoA dehydrogenase